MGFIDRLRRSAGLAIAGQEVRASLETYESLNSPAFLERIRSGGLGGETSSGAVVTTTSAMRVTAVMASVRILATSEAMLPLQLFREVEDGRKEKFKQSPTYRVLYRRPNSWQTSFQFRAMMTSAMLLRGNAYALKQRRIDGTVLGLVPLNPDRIAVEQNDDLSLSYVYTRQNGRQVALQQDDIFHLADWYSTDGFKGLSRIAQAKESIGLALRAEEAGGRMFKQGVIAGGALSTPKGLSETARTNIQESLETKYSGSENAGKWLLLEEDLKPVSLGMSAKDAEYIETRKFQVEDIARIFGVPPHLIGATEKTTSWGTGIEQQTIGFLQYALQPIITAWEQTIIRDCIREQDVDSVYPKHNMSALLRGSSKDRSDYLAKALGSGGHRPWMTQNEARQTEELDKSDDPSADELQMPANAQAEPSQEEPSDEPAQAA